MSFISDYTQYFGINIKYLNKPSILTNEQNYAHHDEENEIVDHKTMQL